MNQQDTAPANVIVQEVASANAGGGMNPSQNQASDGLGDPNVNGTSSGTRYVLQNDSSGII